MRGRYLVVGSALVIVGALGFVLSTPLFEVIAVTPVLNMVHLVCGSYAIIAAFRGLGAMRAAGKLIGSGLVALAVLAFAVDHPSMVNIVPSHDANAWFHLGVGLLFLYHALLAPPQ